MSVKKIIGTKLRNLGPFSPIYPQKLTKCLTWKSRKVKRNPQEVRSGECRFFITEDRTDKRIPRKYEVFFDREIVNFIEHRETRDSSIHAYLKLATFELKNCVSYGGLTKFEIDGTYFTILGLSHTYIGRKPILSEFMKNYQRREAVRIQKLAVKVLKQSKKKTFKELTKEEKSKLYFEIDERTLIWFIQVIRIIEIEFKKYWEKNILLLEDLSFEEEESEEEEGEEEEEEQEQEESNKKKNGRLSFNPLELSLFTNHFGAFQRPLNFRKILPFLSPTLEIHVGQEYLKRSKITNVYVSKGVDWLVTHLNEEERRIEVGDYRDNETDCDIKLLGFGERMSKCILDSERRILKKMGESLEGFEKRLKDEFKKEMRGMEERFNVGMDKLAGDVEDNSKALSKLAGDVEDNTKAIKKLDGNVEENSKAINKLAGDVEENSKAINKLAGDVEENTNAISKLAGNVEENTKAISKLAGNVEENTKAINKLARGVEDNSKAINKLSGDVEENTKALGKLTEDVEDLTKTVSGLSEEIGEIKESMITAEKLEEILVRRFGNLIVNHPKADQPRNWRSTCVYFLVAVFVLFVLFFLIKL